MLEGSSSIMKCDLLKSGLTKTKEIPSKGQCNPDTYINFKTIQYYWVGDASSTTARSTCWT